MVVLKVKTRKYRNKGLNWNSSVKRIRNSQKGGAPGPLGKINIDDDSTNKTKIKKFIQKIAVPVSESDNAKMFKYSMNITDILFIISFMAQKNIEVKAERDINNTNYNKEKLLKLLEEKNINTLTTAINSIVQQLFNIKNISIQILDETQNLNNFKTDKKNIIKNSGLLDFSNSLNNNFQSIKPELASEITISNNVQNKKAPAPAPFAESVSPGLVATPERRASNPAPPAASSNSTRGASPNTGTNVAPEPVPAQVEITITEENKANAPARAAPGPNSTLGAPGPNSTLGAPLNTATIAAPALAPVSNSAPGRRASNPAPPAPVSNPTTHTASSNPTRGPPGSSTISRNHFAPVQSQRTNLSAPNIPVFASTAALQSPLQVMEDPTAGRTETVLILPGLNPTSIVQEGNSTLSASNKSAKHQSLLCPFGNSSSLEGVEPVSSEPRRTSAASGVDTQLENPAIQGQINIPGYNPTQSSSQSLFHRQSRPSRKKRSNNIPLLSEESNESNVYEEFLTHNNSSGKAEPNNRRKYTKIKKFVHIPYYILNPIKTYFNMKIVKATGNNSGEELYQITLYDVKILILYAIVNNLGRFFNIQEFNEKILYDLLKKNDSDEKIINQINNFIKIMIPQFNPVYSNKLYQNTETWLNANKQDLIKTKLLQRSDTNGFQEKLEQYFNDNFELKNNKLAIETVKREFEPFLKQPEFPLMNSIGRRVGSAMQSVSSVVGDPFIKAWQKHNNLMEATVNTLEPFIKHVGDLTRHISSKAGNKADSLTKQFTSIVRGKPHEMYKNNILPVELYIDTDWNLDGTPSNTDKFNLLITQLISQNNNPLRIGDNLPSVLIHTVDDADNNLVCFLLVYLTLYKLTKSKRMQQITQDLIKTEISKILNSRPELKLTQQQINFFYQNFTENKILVGKDYEIKKTESKKVKCGATNPEEKTYKYNAVNYDGTIGIGERCDTYVNASIINYEEGIFSTRQYNLIDKNTKVIVAGNPIDKDKFNAMLWNHYVGKIVILASDPDKIKNWNNDYSENDPTNSLNTNSIKKLFEQSQTNRNIDDPYNMNLVYDKSTSTSTSTSISTST